MKEPLASIIILNYNGMEYIEPLFNSILAQDYKNYEIIFVDNASIDKSLEYVERNYPNVRIIKNSKNLGFAGGNNVGVSNAKGELIVFLNYDTVVEKKWLSELVKSVLSDEKIISSHSITLDEGENYKKLPFIEKYVPEKVKTLNLVGRNVITEVPYREDGFFFPSGCSMIYKRNLIEQPFDDLYFCYSEDVYFGWLARLKGYKIVQVPTSIVHHAMPPEGREQKGDLLFYWERNRLLNFLIFYKVSTFLKIFPLLILDAIIVMLSFAIKKGKNSKEVLKEKGIFSNIFRCFLWLLTNIDEVISKRNKIQKEAKVKEKDVIKFMSCAFFPPSESKIKRIINKLSYYYCLIMGIHTIEFTR
ncbi:MAG: glycosyltransferase family 2 protein [Candidatus Thermoplasmatota archaeon]